MKLGICNEIFKDWNDWQRTCDYVADVGYNGIEIAPFIIANAKSALMTPFVPK